MTDLHVDETVLKLARKLATQHFGLDDSFDMPDAFAQDFIEKFYHGGWVKFVTDNTPRTKSNPSPSNLDTPMAFRRRLVAALGFDPKVRLGDLDEFKAIQVTEDTVTVAIKVVEFTEGKVRWRVTRTGVRLISWKKRPSEIIPGYSIDRFVPDQTLTMWDDEPAFHMVASQYSKIESVDEYRERLSWDEMCYRPGTSKTPMDGDDVRTKVFNEYFRSFGLDPEEE